MTIWFPGAHATLSPSHLLLASVTEGNLRICFTNNPGRCVDFSYKTPYPEIRGLRWSPGSSHVLLLCASSIEVISLDDDSSRVRISNGTAGLGSFATAAFVLPDQVLTVWEFGKAKIWNTATMLGVELEDMKTPVENGRWSMRPAVSEPSANLTYLSRSGSDDTIAIHFPFKNIAIPLIKLPTTDATSLHWSPHGQWLAVLDTTRQAQNVHVLTADGHLFKSFPQMDVEQMAYAGLGVKSIVWSHDSETLALTRYDDCIDIISGRTLSKTAVVQHSAVIEQAEQHNTKVWQEVVAASAARSYTELSTPISPPLSKIKSLDNLRSLGIAEAAFSCDDRYLASRTEAMLSTVWIWDVKSLQLHSVVLQHSNVRRLRWHASLPSLLIIDCGENIVNTYDVTTGNPPRHVPITARGDATFTLLNSNEMPTSITILATTRDSFTIMAIAEDGVYLPGTSDEVYEEDSIFEILAGKANDDKTARLELEAEDEVYNDTMNDTFDGRRAVRPGDIDPLDDSQIF